jgi:hypothetical protein
LAQAFEQIINTVRMVYGSSFYLPLMLAAVFYLIIRRQSAGRVVLVSYSLLMLAAFLLPIVYLILKPFFRDGQVYWRFLWLIPYTVLIALAATDLVSSLPGKAARIAGFVVLTAVLIFGGKTVYTSENWRRSPSFEKVTLPTLQVLNAINRNRQESGNDQAVFAGPIGVMSRIRQVDPSIRLYVGRNLNMEKLSEENPRLFRRMMILDGSMTAEGGDFGGHFRAKKVNYIMVFDEAKADKNLSANGYEAVSRTDNWTLWYNPDL